MYFDFRDVSCETEWAVYYFNLKVQLNLLGRLNLLGKPPFANILLMEDFSTYMPSDYF